MEHQRITNLLGTTINKVTKFITKKWVQVYDQANNTYSTSIQIRFKTSILRSDSCDYSDTYIVVEGGVTVADPNNNLYDKKLAFKNNAPFISCITKIKNTLVENEEDLYRYYNTNIYSD